MVSSGEAARFVAGVLLAGYGSLIVLRLLAHENIYVGAALVLLGVGLLLTLPRRVREEGTSDLPVSGRRRAIVAALGLFLAGGVLGYNLVTRSTLTVPELAILVYGALLMAAAPFLGRRIGPTDVGTAVAWSLPLIAAPLGLYAVDAYFDAQVGVGASPLDAFITHALVAPMAAALRMFGFDAVANEQVVQLVTPRGRLFLSVGVVCAGLEPSILFLGVFGLFAWKEKTPPGRLGLLLALGLGGVYLANLIRLVALAFVGYHRGGAALQVAHAHFGWILFVGWMMAYWWLVLRRFQGASKPRAAA